MKFSSAILPILPSLVLADKTFDAMTVRTGTQFQYGSLSIKDGVVHVNDGNAGIQFHLKDDGTLYDDALKKYLVINDKDQLATADKGSTKFKLGSTYLELEDGSSFYACADNGKYVLGTKQCSAADGSPVALYVSGVKDADNKKPEAKTTVQIPGTTISTVAPSTTTIKRVAKTADITTTKEIKPTKVASVVQGFGLISIHSGSNVQNAAIKKVDSHAQVFLVGGSEGDDLKLTITTDGTLFDQNGRFVFVGENGDVGSVDPWGNQQPTKGFSIKDNRLAYQDSEGFFACPSGKDTYSLTVKGWDGCTGIALQIL